MFHPSDVIKLLSNQVTFLVNLDIDRHSYRNLDTVFHVLRYIRGRHIGEVKFSEIFIEIIQAVLKKQKKVIVPVGWFTYFGF